MTWLRVHKRPAGLAACVAVCASLLAATAPALDSAAADPAVEGEWSAPFTPPDAVTGVHLTLLHTGKVLMFGEEGETAVWNPVTNTTKRIAIPGPIFCGGHTILANGRVFVPGGRIVGIRGPKSTEIFNAAKEQWTHGPDMNAGRYYPTATLLANKKVLITGGTDENAQPNPDVEVYSPGTGTIAQVGTPHYYNLYPHAFVLPDKRVGIVDRIDAHIEDPATWQRTQLAAPTRRAGQKSAILLPGGPSGSSQVMVVGGLQTQDMAWATAEKLDFASPTAWQPLASMPEARHNVNLVLLPDGTAVGIGGNSKGKDELPHLEALLYDPAMNTWTTLAAQAMRRAYHSTALLLPDGRILSAGDNRDGGGQTSLEIFSPPYLFRGPRPVIDSATASVRRRDVIEVQTSSQVDRAVLMAPAAVTHANDMHQRHVELAFTETATGISADVPSTGIAPSGYYMLFLLNDLGVPSEAAWVRVI